MEKGPQPKYTEAVNNGIGVVLTFVFFSFGLLFFRAKSFSDAWYVLGHLFLFSSAGAKDNSLFSVFTKAGVYIPIFLVCLLWTIEYWDRRLDLKQYIAARPVFLRWAIYYVVIISLVMFSGLEKTQFIYFKF